MYKSDWYVSCMQQLGSHELEERYNVYDQTEPVDIFV